MVGYSFTPDMEQNGPNHLPTREVKAVAYAEEATRWQASFLASHVLISVDAKTEEAKEVEKPVPDLIFGLAVLNSDLARTWKGDIKALPKGLNLGSNQVLYVLYDFDASGGFQVAPFNAANTRAFVQYVAGVSIKQVIPSGVQRFRFNFEIEKHFTEEAQHTMTMEQMRRTPSLFSAMLYGHYFGSELLFNDRILDIVASLREEAQEKEERQGKRQEKESVAGITRRLVKKSSLLQFNPRVRRNAGASGQEVQQGHFVTKDYTVDEMVQATFKYLSRGFAESRPPRALAAYKQAAAMATRGSTARAQYGSKGALRVVASTSTDKYSIPAIYRRAGSGWMANIINWIRNTQLLGGYAEVRQVPDVEKILVAMARYSIEPDGKDGMPFSKAALEELKASILSEMQDPPADVRDSYRPAPRVMPGAPADELDALEEENELFARFNPRRGLLPAQAWLNPEDAMSYQEWMNSKFADRDQNSVPKPPGTPNFQAAAGVFRDRGIRSAQAALSTYGARLGAPGVNLVQFDARPPLDVRGFTDETKLSWEQQAGFSLGEARAFADRQIRSFEGRKRSSIPVSSALCSYARSTRLRSYRVPPSLMAACGGPTGQEASQKIVIWMSPSDMSPQRIMTIRRNTHIDCDFVARPPAQTPAQLLALALQDALLWIAQKPRRGQVTRVYVGEVGQSQLQLAWKPGDPLTFQAMLVNLVKAGTKNGAYICELEDYDAAQDRRNYEQALRFSVLDTEFAPAPAAPAAPASPAAPPPPPPAAPVQHEKPESPSPVQQEPETEPEPDPVFTRRDEEVTDASRRRRRRAMVQAPESVAPVLPPEPVVPAAPQPEVPPAPVPQPEVPPASVPPLEPVASRAILKAPRSMTVVELVRAATIMHRAWLDDKRSVDLMRKQAVENELIRRRYPVPGLLSEIATAYAAEKAAQAESTRENPRRF
jgi:hypothetical protein